MVLVGGVVTLAGCNAMSGVDDLRVHHDIEVEDDPIEGSSSGKPSSGTPKILDAASAEEPTTTKKTTAPLDGGAPKTLKSVACGAETCTGAASCCVGPNQVCSDEDGTCPFATSYRFSCGGPSGCEGDQICCYQPSEHTSTCSTSCTGIGRVVCRSGDECPNGLTCVAFLGGFGVCR